ncbi:MAG TPA: serine hydrolase domain-containing protein [Pantanalinema sp.]
MGLWKDCLMPREFLLSNKSSIRLHAILEQSLSETGALGATLALLVDGNVMFRAGLGGLADQPDAKFYAYSVTKSVLAALVLQLAEAGRLDLERPIRTWLPEVQVRTPITLRQLLNHTGGMPDYGGISSYQQAVRRSPETAWKPSRYMELLSDATLLFAPGQGWSYSNLGYMLISRVIEAVGGLTPDESLASRIAAPLGLTETRFVSSRADAMDLTPGFEGSPGRENIIARYDPGWVAHGVVRSTALELARLMEGVTGGRFLGEFWLGQMLSAVPVPGAISMGRDPGYGLGLMAETMPFGRVVGHNGEGPGYSVACWSLTAGGHRLVGACLVNQSIPNAAQTLLFRAFSAVLGA